MKKYARLFCLILASWSCSHMLQVPVDPVPSPTPSHLPTIPLPSPSPTMPPIPKPCDNYEYCEEYEVMIGSWFSKMPNIQKMSAMCPKWELLQNKQQVWNKLWKAVASCESGYNKYSVYQENMGLDSVTGQIVLSQGLFQISFQDKESYHTPECDQLDWSKDKNKTLSDPTKTIFDTKININCSMAIAKKHLEWGSSKWKFPPQEYWNCLRDVTDGPSKFKKLAPECF